MTTERTQSNVLWGLAGLTALGVAVRFASLGVQSYHHDEVITAARVIPGNFTDMLHQVKASESNPPLYYVLAWGWAKAFGTGEIGMRSLSALFGAATVPVAYLIGRELASKRAGLITAAIVAVNPMLIWYSQEARSYAVLVFFGALALLFFVRALNSRHGRDLGLWALASGLALCSHYFAVFAVAIEAAWLLVALRSRWRSVLPAIGAVIAVGLALLPLISAQINPTHIGWIDHSPFSSRLFETGVSFLAGETGHVIAEPPRERYALIPVALVSVALLLLALRGGSRERRGGALGLVVGVGVVLLASGAALVGKDYIVERNLLPALIPLAATVGLGFGASGARRAGAVCAVLLCAYWLAFDVHVARTPNLQRPDFRDLTERLGPPTRPRAILTWKLAADPIQFYLDGRSERVYSGEIPVREIDVISKPIVARKPPGLPPGFRPVERLRLERLTLTRYMSPHLRQVPFYALRDARTGFGSNAVVADGLPPSAWGSR
ncbi:MAG TPA: glycosyltransferase family 39 protein [Solirubrobacterales bacterium]|nr:glycosyltransferase family 39 protein [Solirubrobacterales bacterium]